MDFWKITTEMNNARQPKMIAVNLIGRQFVDVADRAW
jgi:hypothetical protein